VSSIPEGSEWLEAGEWDEHVARETARAIVADARAHRTPDGLWAVHPSDYAGPDDPEHFAGLYLGAAGMEWALRELGDPTPDRPRSTSLYLRAPDTGAVVPGLWLGESGPLLVDWLEHRDAGTADQLLTCIRANAGDQSNEIMWGAPGTMLAADTVHSTSGDERFAQAWRQAAERLWEEWRYSPQTGHLWTQQLYGKTGAILGPAHGFASNVRVLWRGRRLLDSHQIVELERRTVATATTCAIHQGELVNWPPAPGEVADRVQWCHGAPGMICSLADLASGDSQFTDLLCRGGELVWQAGPHVKGHGLCHGTAGNGHALLALHRRTMDARWLERARVFAMQAIGQYQAARARFGVGRYSLFTGDIGLALYLESCIRADPGFPTIDRF
jgi:hypothetical protein